jgi:hypothetical protein
MVFNNSTVSTVLVQYLLIFILSLTIATVTVCKNNIAEGEAMVLLNGPYRLPSQVLFSSERLAVSAAVVL